MADLIEVKNFKISFAGKTVIKNLSFSIKKGEIFGLLGSNGCGKTTTIRTLLGLYRADSGKLLINGKPFDQSSDIKVGYLPEERGLYKKESVIDTMTYFARLRGVKNPKAWSLAYLERVGLTDHAKTKIEKLSQGMQQKVQLGNPAWHYNYGRSRHPHSRRTDQGLRPRQPTPPHGYHRRTTR